MKFVRFILGGLVLFVSWLTWPRAGKRPEEKQKEVEMLLKNYSLYQFHSCPFCVKVRRAMQRLNLPIELRDAKSDPVFRDELLQQGGKIKAPCLRIERADGVVEWMYESNDIIAYLEKTFPLEK